MLRRITSYNVCYTKLLRAHARAAHARSAHARAAHARAAHARAALPASAGQGHEAQRLAEGHVGGAVAGAAAVEVGGGGPVGGEVPVSALVTDGRGREDSYNFV